MRAASPAFLPEDEPNNVTEWIVMYRMPQFSVAVSDNSFYHRLTKLWLIFFNNGSGNIVIWRHGGQRSVYLAIVQRLVQSRCDVQRTRVD